MTVDTLRRDPPKRSKPWPETWVAAAFVAPAALVILLVVVVPLARAAWMSLFDIELTKPGVEPFVGLGNYITQLTSASFWDSVSKAFFFTVVTTALELSLGIGLAMLMDQPMRLRWVLRSLVILPWALPTIVNALMWRWIDNATYGSLNALLTQVGFVHDYVPWLSQETTAMWMVIIADVWKMTPFCAILILAGLQGIDRELFEAARVDGASTIQMFRHIILPLLTPIILIVLVLRTMEAFKVFDVIWIMTGGGPASSTQTVAIYAYRTAYQGYDFGQGAALGYIIAIAIMLLAAVYLWLLRRTGSTKS
ncbi:MAG: sugar ABC transporter permease [Candidatus Limnocylindrales bacterium]|jgi:multiple sugar transport system permease protein/N,N'-diacetylchitobiose transport system permease protein